MRRLILFLFLLGTLAAKAGPVTVHYWFDQNYASRDSVVCDTGQWRYMLDVGALRDGLHTLNLQLGEGSAAELRSYIFYKMSQADSSAYSLHYDCWFDQNYAARQGGTLGTGSLLFDVGALRDGLHTLNLQLGEGSAAELRSYIFYKMSQADSTAFSLHYDCWFDQDYAARQGGTLGTGSLLLEVGTLRDGLHTLNLQLGEGSATELRSYIFYKMSQADSSAFSLHYDCWFDQDYAARQGGTLGTGSLLFDVGALRDGLHTLNLQLGEGSAAELRSYIFYKIPQVEEHIFSLHYDCWFDQDYAAHQSGTLGTGSLLLDVGTLRDGLHTLNLQLGEGAAAELHSYIFYKMTPREMLADTAVLRYYYAIDGRQREPIEVSPTSGLIHLELDVNDITVGLHTLNCFLMTDDGSSTSLYSTFFYKAPVGGLGITRYEYCLNGDYDNFHSTNVTPRDTLRLITLLPVDTMPIRSTCFHFNPNNGSPVIYAKNDITFRFWNTEQRFTEATKQYVDENVMEIVLADTLERDTTKVVPVPNNNQIHWFKLAAGVGDSLSFRTDRRCTMQLYAPSGEMVFRSSGDSVLQWDGCHAWEDGDYYLAVHDAEGSGNVAVSYQWIYRYAVLAQNVYNIGNGGVSAISFEGNGFYDLDTVFLVSPINDTLYSLSIIKESNTFVTCNFDFLNVDTGYYYVLFVFDGDTFVVSEVKVVPPTNLTLVSSINYPQQTWQQGFTYYITIVNTGNMTAFGVPIYTYLGIPSGGNISRLIITFTFKDKKGRTRVKKMPPVFENGGNVFTDEQKAEINHIFDDIGDLVFLYPVNTDNANEFPEYGGTILVNIPPESELTITKQVFTATHTNVEHWDAVPYEAPPVIMPNEGENPSLSSLWCCYHDRIECALNIISDIAGLASVNPEWEYAAGIVNCVAGLGANVLSAYSSYSCGTSPRVPLKTAVDAVSISSMLFSCISNILPDEFNAMIPVGLREENGRFVTNAQGRFEVEYMSLHSRFDAIKAIGGFFNRKWSKIAVNTVSLINHSHDCYEAWSVKKPNCPPSNHLGGTTNYVTPGDPNDIRGFIVNSGSHTIDAEQEQLFYVVEFENDSALATSHAHRVIVNDTLDGNVFDLNSFSASSFSIGDEVVTVDGQSFTRTVDMRPEIDVIAQVQLDYNMDTSFAVATWTFSSLDPMTMQPTTSDTLGFLAIGGTGEVNFTINRKMPLPDSTVIANRAVIVFDNEAPVATSTWVNIVDNMPPVSVIDSILLDGDTTTVFVSATDNLSGVWRYNIYAQIGDEVLLPLALNVAADTTASFVPPDGTVRFYCAATDSAGNAEQVAIVHPVVYDTAYVTMCDGYSWFDSLYTIGGQYSRTKMHTEAGKADSVWTLFLTINHSTTGDTTATSCDSFTWHGTTYVAGGAPAYQTVNAAGCDSTVTLHLTINYSTTGDTTVTSCDSFTWHGTTYTAGGSPTYQTVNAAGCDSTVTLHLTINNSTTGDTTATACDSFTWHGTTYTASGDVHGSTPLQNVVGCDSTVTLHLTINHSTIGDTTATSCDSFTWHGTTYTASGDVHGSTPLQNVVGCDSTITLHVTINHSTTGDTTATSCDSFTWHGTTYVAGGAPAYQTVNAAGCDSTVTLHLTINHSTTGDTTATSCDSFTWHGTTYIAGGAPTYQTVNAAGCDSTVTLHLTINYSTTGDTTVTSCDSFTWQGTTYTSSGDVHGSMPLQNAAGCDSTVTLHLTINYSVTVFDTLTIGSNELPYDYYGNTINEEGNYTFNGTTFEGCDSTTYLNVTVNQIGIEDIQDSKFKILIYPNPTSSGWLNIEGDDVIAVEVFDLSGRKVSEIYGANRIYIGALLSGTYVVRTVCAHGTATHRVVLE